MSWQSVVFRFNLRSLKQGRGGRIFCLMLFLLILGLSQQSWARTGGGGGYSGGGGSSSGSSSFSSSYRSSSSGSSRSSGGEAPPGFILIFFIIVIIFIIFGAKSGNQTRVIRKASRISREQKASEMKAAEQRIQQRDPDFSIAELEHRCAAVFPKVQEAWSEQDMQPVRPFISDGIFSRFELQIAMQKLSLIRNPMSDVNVFMASVVGIESDQFFDTVHVEITASAIDCTLSTTSNSVVQGSSTEPTRFSEIWSFLRRPGAKTLTKSALLEGYCPNCGQPLPLLDKMECPSCQALINSGEYDWVLAEITQIEVWQPISQQSESAWLKAYRQHDPGFNRQHIEDKASVIFWKLRAAEMMADDALLNSVALPDYRQKNHLLFSPLSNGKHRFVADAAVGSVDLVALEPARNENGRDQLFINFKWSGHREEKEVPSAMAPAYRLSSYINQTMVLVRNAGVRSSTKNILSSAHCPGCAAPETRNSSGVCDYCGTAQNDGSSDWVLARVENRLHTIQMPRIVNSNASTIEPAAASMPLLSAVQREPIVRACALVMMADGVMDPKERSQLETLARRQGVNASRLEQIITDAQSRYATVVLERGSNDENRQFIIALIRSCLADGKVTASEKKLIKSLVSRLGYVDADVNYMIRAERAKIYKASRTLIRESKRSAA